MGIGIGVGVGLWTPGAAFAAPAVNPNLLVATERFDATAWSKAGTTVDVDAENDPLGLLTGDRVNFHPITGVIAQTSLVAAVTGSANSTFTPTSTYARVSVTATFDTGQKTFSVFVLDPDDGELTVRINLAVVGGVVVCSLLDSGSGAAFIAWGAKLEVGAIPTGTAATYGAVA